MRLSFVKPRLELQPYIESFWVFESATGIAEFGKRKPLLTASYY